MRKGSWCDIELEYRLYGSAFASLLESLDGSLLELNKELKEQFTDRVYHPIIEEIINHVKVFADSITYL